MSTVSPSFQALMSCWLHSNIVCRPSPEPGDRQHDQVLCICIIYTVTASLAVMYITVGELWPGASFPVSRGCAEHNLICDSCKELSVPAVDLVQSISSLRGRNLVRRQPEPHRWQLSGCSLRAVAIVHVEVGSLSFMFCTKILSHIRSRKSSKTLSIVQFKEQVMFVFPKLFCNLVS